nr:beta-D-glucosyl crocetin beta-1,6-glucosyltransferase-like [Ipomoea batatas]GMD79898.1 beta-D-glucosyl crocetin beta-1,6-glucosyltransferase-like [Ipomoea batatas]
MTGITHKRWRTVLDQQRNSDEIQGVALSPHVQANPPLDDSDHGLTGEEVRLFPIMKTCASPKNLFSSMKRFNACQKRVVREIVNHPMHTPRPSCTHRLSNVNWVVGFAAIVG